MSNFSIQWFAKELPLRIFVEVTCLKMFKRLLDPLVNLLKGAIDIFNSENHLKNSWQYLKITIIYQRVANTV
jgi:hypothetical protein